MTDEIKEILHLLKRCDNTYLKIENSNGEKEYEYHQVNDLRLDGYHSQLLLDYITNLQEENKEYSMIFDTFSKRPYAHKYLEEKKKKLNNNKIIGLDSEMVYKDYYDYKSRCEKAIKSIDIVEEIIKKQPDDFGNGDMWILKRLEGFKFILNGVDEK